MKIILTALNSKFIHSNLAIRYLREYCRAYRKAGRADIEIAEYTINDPLDNIIGDLAMKDPDIIGFSCYIWNIEHTLKIAKTIKMIMPRCIILLGGPEVSFECEELMTQNPFVDYIISGEGEEAFLEFLEAVDGGREFCTVKGLYRREGFEDKYSIVYNGCRESYPDFESLPFPYPEGFDGLKNKIIYYEMSRGCPFNCQFCLSSTVKGVRFMPLDRIYNDIKTFVEAGVMQVKLVDRTFNCNVKRAREIFSMIMDLNGKTNFHFEMAGDLIDDETCELLSKAPPGMFQFEIGVQSTNEYVLNNVKRRTDFNKLSSAVKKIKGYGNIHIHMDLIAGLPGEDYQSFAQSFNDVASLRPDMLQLGFLKLLKGSGLRTNAGKYGYRFTDYPPYEVVCSNSISYRELWRLKRIEELTEYYFNTGRFEKSLNYLSGYFDNKMFMLFENMAGFWIKNNYFCVKHSNIRLYEILLQFAESLKHIDMETFSDVVLFDYLIAEKSSVYPKGTGHDVRNSYDIIRRFLSNEDNIAEYLPQYEGQPLREITKKIHIAAFNADVTRDNNITRHNQVLVLFDYGNPNEGRKKAEYKKISMQPSI